MPINRATFLIVVLLVIWSLYRLSRDPNVNFNVLDLLMEGGRVSKVSVIVMSAFVVHSWVMVDLQAEGDMSEGYLTIYGVTWVAPLLTRLFMTAGTPTK